LGLDSAANDGVYTHEWTPSSAGRYEFLFPNNDVVKINVFDPASMKTYQASSEGNFDYRKFAGIPLTAADDGIATVTLPFALKFGSPESSFEEISIDSNGVMSVTQTQSLGFNNQEFPVMRSTSIIAPYWDDLSPGVAGGDIYVGILGEAPNREFVVDFRDVLHYNSPEGASFQVVFFENSTDILFNYLKVDFGNPNEDKGASATVGIQTSPDRFITYSYNEPKLANNQSLRFSLVN